MVRTLPLAVVIFAFSGVAFAECTDDHKANIINDQQANASQAPVTVKPALPTASKAGDTKHAKKSVSDNPSPSKVLAVNKPTD